MLNKYKFIPSSTFQFVKDKNQFYLIVSVHVIASLPALPLDKSPTVAVTCAPQIFAKLLKSHNNPRDV
jgi:hypothetical protein